MKHILQSLFAFFFIATVFLISLDSQAQTISTFAGNGTPGSSGNSGQATQAELNGPTGIAFDDTGNLYIADEFNNMIRKVSLSGVITTVAGSGGVGAFAGDGGPATAAKLSSPTGVAVDTKGNIYIADHSNNRVRKVAAGTGIITTIAGNGTPSFSGDLGQATAAELYTPFGVAVDTSGSVYISDFGNNRIRKVTVGIIVTIAGTGKAGYSGDNIIATSSDLSGPEGITVDDSGNVYIADFGNDRIRKVSASNGFISTVAGDGTGGYIGDGMPATSSELFSPTAVAVDISGDIFISDYGNYRIRKVDGTGTINTIAGDGNGGYKGDGGPATAAKISKTNGVTVDTGGNVYIADWGNNVIRKVNVCEIVLALNPSSPVICSGSSIALTVSGGTYYTWSPSTGLSATTGDTVFANPTSNITYTVTSAGNGTCSGKITVPVGVIPSPNKPTITKNGDTLVSSSQYDNQWYRNDSALSDTTQYLIITALGDYWVSTVNEANGCSTSSDTTVISGIRQLSAISNQLSIYPNPFTSDIVIKINSSAGNLSGWYMQITDVLGRLLYTKPSLNYSNDIDLSDLPNGIYFLSVITNAEKTTLPVLKQ